MDEAIAALSGATLSDAPYISIRNAELAPLNASGYPVLSAPGVRNRTAIVYATAGSTVTVTGSFRNDFVWTDSQGRELKTWRDADLPAAGGKFVSIRVVKENWVLVETSSERLYLLTTYLRDAALDLPVGKLSDHLRPRAVPAPFHAKPAEPPGMP